MISCKNNSKQPASSPQADSNSMYKPGSFGYDVEFLRQHDSIISLYAESEPGRVIVSPKYQGKVFTSTATGNEGASFGWINYKAFTAPPDTHMNAYGGENRFWLGPEGNVFSLFFEKGKEMVFDNWKTPAAFDTEPWAVTLSKPASVQMQKYMELQNYAGTRLQLEANRTITILNKKEIAARLANDLAGVESVGYLAANSITNKGNTAWNEKTGMPCIWMLDMFNPSPGTVIAVPYQTAVKDTAANIATTDYFGQIPPERISYSNGVLLFKADGRSRGKLGLSAARARQVAGSYDAAGKVLTIIMYDVDPQAGTLNQEWNTQKPPFSGDAVNAYNDGPLENGSQMGPFYELESVSPAAFLLPGATLTHNHYVFHFTGAAAALSRIAGKALGISLEEMERAF